MSKQEKVPIVCEACGRCLMVIHRPPPNSVTTLSGIVKYHCAQCGLAGCILPTPPAHRDAPEKLTACGECEWISPGLSWTCNRKFDTFLGVFSRSTSGPLCEDVNIAGHCPHFKPKEPE